MKVLVEGSKYNLEVNLIIKTKNVSIEKSSLEDQRSTYKRLKDSLNIEDLDINVKYLSDIEDIIRNENDNVNITTYKNKLLHLKRKDEFNNSFGLAINIGTTAITIYMMNLITWQEVDVISQVNRQRNYGAYVILRIFY